MSIPQKMKSTTRLILDSVDLYATTDLIARLQQGTELFEFPLSVVESHVAILGIDKATAEKLSEKKPVEVQILWNDEYGMPHRTNIRAVTVDRILGGGFGD